MAMTHEEMQAEQDRIGCTNLKLAEWLGVTPVTICYWRKGNRKIPNMAALAIQALADGWRPR